MSIIFSTLERNWGERRGASKRVARATRHSAASADVDRCSAGRPTANACLAFRADARCGDQASAGEDIDHRRLRDESDQFASRDAYSM